MKPLVLSAAPAVGFAFAAMVCLTARAENPASAPALPVVRPEDAGLSSEKLAKVDAKVLELIAAKRLAGASVVVTRHGKMVYNKSFGLRDLANEKPMTSDTVIRIYSMSKAITSAAAMILLEEEKLTLDDPIAKHLPAFSAVKVWKGGKAVAPSRAPTVRDLLRHTTGYSYGATAIPEINGAHAAADAFNKDNTLARMAEKMAGVPLAFDPGTDWMYGVSTDILGAVVEAASGMPFAQFLQKRLFVPLAMPDTTFTLADGMKERLAVVYHSDKRGTLTDAGHDDFRYTAASRLPSGGGGLLSTIRDYTRFLQMIANGGELQGVRILKKETVAVMTRNQLSHEAMPVAFGPLERKGTGFGLGFSVKVAETDWNKDGRLGEYGWGGLASTHYWVSPEDELVVVTMEQTLPYNFLLEETLKPLIYDAITE